MGDQHQKQERIPNPDLENKEVEKLEELEGETLSRGATTCGKAYGKGASININDVR